MRKRVECDCEWCCEGTDEELTAAVTAHAREAHRGREPSAEQILAMAEPVEPEGAR